jgi:asparagine synthase (glutamine-hydrolysing)
MIDTLIHSLDQIPMDLRYASVYSMYERVRSLGHKVVLIGQGPDELFLGYYYDDDFWRFPPEQTSAAYLASEYFPGKTAFGMDAWRPEFLNKDKASQLSMLNMEKNYLPATTDDPLNNLTFFAQRTMLQSVLTMEDRLSSAHSLEARVPWLDHRIVELAYRIPSYQKIDAPDDNKAKWLNRKAMRGIVPSHITDRRKAPFPHPPADYRSQILDRLIVPHMPDLRRSDFLQHMLRTEFLETIGVNENLSGKDLFKIYSLWRFGKLFFS